MSKKQSKQAQQVQPYFGISDAERTEIVQGLSQRQGD